jgi:pimeloyl-ACP methyl ester carboxylesterase
VNVVFLHALPLDPRMWDAQRERFGGEAPALYPLGSSLEEWADAVLAQVDGQFVAVGASMGGYCACAIARHAPERLRGLVLSGSRADADPPDRRPVRDEWIRVATEEGAEGLWREMGPRLFPEHADPAVVERAHAIALEQAPEDLARAVGAIRDRLDSTEAVTRLPIPLLVLVGDSDPLVDPDYARGLAADAPLGAVRVFEGAGHLANLEQPDEFNRVLGEFLESA